MFSRRWRPGYVDTKLKAICDQVTHPTQKSGDLPANFGLDHVDAAIRIFDPNVDFETIKPRIPPRHMAFKGEVSRLILNALRKAGKPLPVSELTLAGLRGRGLSADDKPFVSILSKRVGACPTELEEQGLGHDDPAAGQLRPLGNHSVAAGKLPTALASTLVDSSRGLS